MFRIDLGIVIGADNNSPVAVVQEVLKGIIEQVERYEHAYLLIFQISGRFLK